MNQLPQGDTMMKQEFLDLAEMSSINDEWYGKIEKVYTYHPAIENKQDIVKLYLGYGMVVIEDMLPRAEQIEELEGRIQSTKTTLAMLNQELREARGE